MRRLFRVAPKGLPAAYKTYQILAPASTHWRAATCAEVDCPAWLRGWSTTVDESTELGARQAHYIRRQSGRGFVEQRTPAGLTTFVFEAGQRCFAADKHRVQVRPESYLIRPGDWRDLGDPRRLGSARSWVDDFGEHQQRIAEHTQRG
ncbi:hypothetical protein [Micromonospora haikouensis]|uniref:hypothetical protein n=1 Tax=Micromonospora haikouensis TaxID=686309 RepID=UPI003D705B82